MRYRDNIKEKTILLIGDNNFFGYMFEIQKALLVLGAKKVLFKQIDFICSLRNKITIRNIIACLKNPRARSKWTSEIINEIEHENIDTLFVVKDICFNKNLIKWLRNRNEDFRAVWFVWDKLDRYMPRYKDFIAEFDMVYSFDRDDAHQYRIKYQPDFFIDDNKIESIVYDISFIGSMHSRHTFNRARIISQIQDFCKVNNLSYFFWIKYDSYPNNKGIIKKIYRKIRDRKYMAEIKKYMNKGFLHTESLPLSEYNSVMKKSKAIIDINHHNRQGMTINAITALGLGKKLITTNKRIAEESFYNSANIFILDEINPHIDLNFMLKPSAIIDLSYLRLENWLLKVVNEEN